ncbi:type II secretion system protein [bacterium]|nr:type II secretion system protein [bacterium]
MNGEQSRQSRVNSEQNDINANNCRTVNSRQFTHNSSLSAVHSLAFTLAETLIVMGIIGVVAALTIPNASKSTNNAEKVARFKKIYAELNEAHDRMTAIYGPIEKWPNKGDSKSKRYIDRITEFIKVTKSCGPNGSDNLKVDCMTNYNKNKLDGALSTESNGAQDALSVILANGASFGVNMRGSSTYLCGGNYYDDESNSREIYVVTSI